MWKRDRYGTTIKISGENLKSLVPDEGWVRHGDYDHAVELFRQLRDETLEEFEGEER